MSRPTRRFHLPSAIRQSPVRIGPQRARALLADGAVLVDVHRHDDGSEPLEGAERILPDEIPERLDRFARDTPIVLACT